MQAYTKTLLFRARQIFLQWNFLPALYIYLQKKQIHKSVKKKKRKIWISERNVLTFLFEVLCFVILNFTYIHNLKNNYLNKMKEGLIQVE